MVEFIDAISKIWPVIISMIALVAWLVRIESNVTVLKEKTAALQARHDTLNLDVMKKMSEISNALSRIEGVMSVKQISSA